MQEEDLPPQRDRVIIAHRGASGYLPEHTLEGYSFAYAMRADYIELDVVLSRDNHPICVHDIYLDNVTNVRHVFPDRGRADGKFYVADFTLEELKRLRPHERFLGRFPQGKSRFEIPTLKEAIELIQGLNASTGRCVGLFVELKDTDWHHEEGFDLEKSVLEELLAHDYTSEADPVFVQCFEQAALRRLREELDCPFPLLQLMWEHEKYDAMAGPGARGLEDVASYTIGISVSKAMLQRDPTLLTRAHGLNLMVNVYTFRADQLADGYNSHAEELRDFLKQYDVDGIITDFADTAVSVNAELAAPPSSKPYAQTA
ncbi:MAG: glycerophosphodiester phosphodiesterase [Candidatus Hydrogenedentota bacterium]